MGKQDLKKNPYLLTVCEIIRVFPGGLFFVAVKSILNEEVSKYEKKYRGKELLGFVNYKTFETVVKHYLGQLIDPALKMLQKVMGEELS